MRRTPWIWIITAYILATLFLTSFGFYRNEIKQNTIGTKSQIVRLQKVIKDKDNEIAILTKDLNRERKKKLPTNPSPTSSSEEVKNLKKVIDNKENTINKQNRSIRALNDSITKLQKKLDYFISAPK